MSESDRADHVGLMSISLTSMWNAARNAGGDPPNIGDNALFETTRTVHDAQARYTKLRSDIAKRPRLIAKIPKDCQSALKSYQTTASKSFHFLSWFLTVSCAA
jgi:hypothetical protein